jgi:catechol 2,3-dioxygenase-like lactoylglutathione lyase family enzyme
MTATATQAIDIQTTGVHHVAIRTTDLARSRAFYVDRLGFSPLLEQPGVVIFAAGGTAIAIRAPSERTAADDCFDSSRVGLDHLALGCTDPAELRRVTEALTAAGIPNTGVKNDETLGKDYVAFKDPDGVSWEFYMV